MWWASLAWEREELRGYISEWEVLAVHPWNIAVQGSQFKRLISAVMRLKDFKVQNCSPIQIK